MHIFVIRRKKPFLCLNCFPGHLAVVSYGQTKWSSNTTTDIANCVMILFADF